MDDFRKKVDGGVEIVEQMIDAIIFREFDAAFVVDLRGFEETGVPLVEPHGVFDHAGGIEKILMETLVPDDLECLFAILAL